MCNSVFELLAQVDPEASGEFFFFLVHPFLMFIFLLKSHWFVTLYKF